MNEREVTLTWERLRRSLETIAQHQAPIVYVQSAPGHSTVREVIIAAQEFRAASGRWPTKITLGLSAFEAIKREIENSIEMVTCEHDLKVSKSSIAGIPYEIHGTSDTFLLT